MKKILYLCLIVVSSTIISCAQEQCECQQDGNNITYTNDDAKDAGVDLATYCEGLDGVVKLSNPTNQCTLQ
ncbi:MAG: hypothetical protein COX70_00390 [Flavobacteriales bacterium CG_4_10_14_0_2_um_filter_32_8]|nr:MAG: hypothetical protein COX70_00390 [Flavobacteriales bacterium CG_4_10_14_0_2_um_filter_32_8]PJB13818.1 MAG: hypothetical protein CO118_11855 [Flavobacteriales bacterium CG_4_9_14_3_um_filter_32_8]